MKNGKKILAAALSLVMGLSLCACNNGGSGSEKNELIIGGIGPMTGPTAQYGNGVMNAAQLAVEEINAAGGVNGMTLKFIPQDDENVSEKAENAYNSLKDSGAKLIIGTVTSTPCKAISPLTKNDNMFMLTPSGSAVECVQFDNAFRICFSDPNQGIAAAQYIKNNNVASKIGVIYDSSDVYSSGIYEKFRTEAASLGLEIVSSQAFTSDSNKDFSVQLQQIKSAGADLIFLPIYYQEAALILTQAHNAGLETKFFGCDGLDGVIKQLGNDAAYAEGVMLLTAYTSDSKEEKSAAFTKAYSEKYNDSNPNQFAADAYDAVYTIKVALEKADVKDASISASELCDLLKKAMTEIEVDGVTGHMVWDESGEPTKDPKAMQIVDGAYTALD